MTVLCHGVSGFDSLQCANRNNCDRLILYAFHLLPRDGQDLRQREPVERGAMLSALIKSLFAIRYGEHFEGDGAVFYDSLMIVRILLLLSGKGAISSS